ncbi:MAG: MerR family transcriptional regulator, light-induced transcriptional regulator [Patescibacteria group bacterium]|nr:MerR family transcriptional regulator, light-induced transcriptional regulator [Patescibacteria group bacterium]
MIEVIWNNLESFVTFATILISGYIFFNDPIRRWRFFGYRPSVLVILIDPSLKIVVFVNSGGSWTFSQGGVYNSDIYEAVEDVLRRDLSLKPDEYRLFYTKVAGKATLSKDWQKNYPIFGGVAFSSEIKGKAYIACMVMIDSKMIKEMGYGVSEYKVVDQLEASEIFKDSVKNESKLKILKYCLTESGKATSLWAETMGI